MSEQDVLHRFLFEQIGVRGLWVSLETSWQSAKQQQHCSENVQEQLGQGLAAVVLLSASIKFNGSMILQAQGEGPLKTLVAQATHDRKIRGLIRGGEVMSTSTLRDMFGEGCLVITVDTDNAHPYQGIVPLEGDNLAAALENYFSRSEQLNTRLWLFADQSRATGLLIQELPAQCQDKEDWQRVEMLASTVTEQEMLTLDCETLLYRLFNEEQVRLFDAEDVTFACSCSREKIDAALRQLGREELESMLEERGLIEVNCEFCNQQYTFDIVDVEQLLLCDQSIPVDLRTQH